MSVDIYSLSGEWQFSSEEIIKGRNVSDLGEEGIFRCHRLTKEAETWAFSAHGEYDNKYAILEFVLDREELTNPREMTAGEILSLPWSEYEMIIAEIV